MAGCSSDMHHAILGSITQAACLRALAITVEHVICCHNPDSKRMHVSLQRSQLQALPGLYVALPLVQNADVIRSGLLSCYPLLL